MVVQSDMSDLSRVLTALASPPTSGGVMKMTNSQHVEWIIDQSSPFIMGIIRARAAEGMKVVQATEIEPDLSYPLSKDDFQLAVNGDMSYNPQTYADSSISLMTGPTAVESHRIEPVVKSFGAIIRKEGIK